MNFFFLFLIANYAKLKMQKEKSRKKIFYIGKKTAKQSLVILFALVIYTAPTVFENRMGFTRIWNVLTATARYFYGLNAYSDILLQNLNFWRLFWISLPQVAKFPWLYNISLKITVKCCTVKELWHKNKLFCRSIAL